MLALNNRINNRHKIVKKYNGGSFEEFSKFLNYHALFFFYYNGVSYFYYKGYIAYYNREIESFGLSVDIDNRFVKNAFDAIKDLTIKQ